MENVVAENRIDRKDFMRQVGLSIGGIILMNCLQSCTETEIPDPVDPTNTGKLDITLDLNKTDYSGLKTKGGFAVINASKVIAARTLDDNFIAVQSDCTHQGTTINFRSSTSDFRCPNHGSTFSKTGAVTAGPATAALKKYNTSFDATANTLRIFE